MKNVVSKSAKVRSLTSVSRPRDFSASSTYSFFSGNFSGFPEKLKDSDYTRNSHATHQHNENATNIG